jgi:hypothetical protein
MFRNKCPASRAIYNCLDSRLHGNDEPIVLSGLNIDKPAECQAGYGFGNVMRSRPMGESKLKKAKHAESLMTCAGVQTVAGRVQVRWKSKSASTPMAYSAILRTTW